MREAVEIHQEARNADLRQCLYAAAFLVPGVEDVTYQDGVWRFELSQPSDRHALEARLKRTIARFANPAGAEQIAFSVTPAEGTSLPGLDPSLPDTQKIGLGLNVYDAPFARLLRFLDAAILNRFAPEFKPREEAYPNIISVEALWKANHLSGFPEHLHFVTHLTPDVDLLDGFAQRARSGPLATLPAESVPLAPLQYVHNPSTCYHCYARRTGMDIGANQAVTAVTKCHRFEAINHREPGRLMEFTMREVIFLGEPDFVRETRQRSLGLVEKIATDWLLYGSLVTANDPFFSSDFTNKANQQHRLAMKYEYKALLPPHGSISVLSSNLHGPTFSKAFAITQRGRPINTGCIGFGYERLALAIIAQHGADPDRWPEVLASEYASWRTQDPLGF